MSDRFYLCADAGTTCLKLALFEAGGRIIGTYAAFLESRVSDSGESEMDMEGLWSAFQAGVGELGNRSPENRDALRRLSGIGICAQGDGFWPLDAERRPFRPAILWNDTRARDLMPEVEEKLGALYAQKRTAAQFSGANAVLLRWLKDEMPVDYHRTAHVLHCKDWLNYRLTGEIATDFSDAGTSLFSRVDGAYDFSALEILGVAEKAAAFPPVFASGETVGRTRPEVLPFVPEGVPVIAGSLDLVAASLGLGQSQPEETLAILGTTFCTLQVVPDDAIEHWPALGSILFSLIPGRSLRLLASLNGAGVLDWGRRVLGNLSIEDAEAEAEAVPPGCEGIGFFPCIYGERAPFRDPMGCGAFVGLRVHHGRGHMLRAVYEGLALMTRASLLEMPRFPSSLGLTGGASRSPLLCRILADCLQIPIRRVASREPGLEGIFRILTGRIEERGETERSFLPGDPELYRIAIQRFDGLLENREIFKNRGR